MKKLAFLLTVVSMLTVAHGQTMTKTEARQFLQTSWNYVKMKDSVSFAALWSLDDSESKNHKRPHSAQRLYVCYDAMRQWMDTAITRNLAIDNIEIEDMNLTGTDTKYWIKAWFKYDKHYYKGYGFYIAYYNNKWVVRDEPSTSSLTK